MSKYLRSALIAVTICGMSAEAFGALQIVVAPGHYVDSRSTASSAELVWNPPAGPWSGGDFIIAWVITPNGTDFTYKYTVTTPSGGNNQLSHWILALSQKDAADNSLQSHWEDIFVDGNGYSDTAIQDVPAGEIKVHGSGGNPGKPSDVYGVKFERDGSATTTMVEFTTSQVPVWGDFYAKDGSVPGGQTAPPDRNIYAYNAKFGTIPDVTTTDFSGWIPRPDGATLDPNEEPDIPEPVSLAVWSCLAAIGVGTTRRRRS